MKVCMILEGCYPYVRGGVSAWAHQYMSSSPEIEFVLWTVHASPEDTREMLYTLPDNVTAHYHVYLDQRRVSRGGRAKAADRQQAVDAIATFRLLTSFSASKIRMMSMPFSTAFLTKSLTKSSG